MGLSGSSASSYGLNFTFPTTFYFITKSEFLHSFLSHTNIKMKNDPDSVILLGKWKILVQKVTNEQPTLLMIIWG